MTKAHFRMDIKIFLIFIGTFTFNEKKIRAIKIEFAHAQVTGFTNHEYLNLHQSEKFVLCFAKTPAAFSEMAKCLFRALNGKSNNFGNGKKLTGFR